MGLFIDAFCNNLESAATVKTQRARIPDIGMETQTGPPPADIFQQSEANAFSLTIFTDKKRADIIPVQQTDKSLNLTLIAENKGFSGRQQFTAQFSQKRRGMKECAAAFSLNHSDMILSVSAGTARRITVKYPNHQQTWRAQ